MMPQWSPVMKTGNTSAAVVGDSASKGPQWSPVMKTGNTPRRPRLRAVHRAPQWSPVMKTGNTAPDWASHPEGLEASMEPGHEDREYPASAW